MSQKLTKTLRGLGSLLRNPWLLNHVLATDETAWRARALVHAPRRPVTAAGLPVASLASLLPETGETVRPFAFRDGASLPSDLALLRALLRRAGGGRYFEIGTWRGESAANVADLASEVYTLNLSGAEMRALGLAERYIALHGFFSHPLPNVHHLHGNSGTYDFAALGQFDLIFIDGDHRYEAVRTDTRRVFEHLVGPATVVVWHDASRQPGQPRWEVVAGILDGLPAAAPGQLTQVSNCLCALYSPVPLPVSAPDLLADPTPYFELTIKPVR